MAATIDSEDAEMLVQDPEKAPKPPATPAHDASEVSKGSEGTHDPSTRQAEDVSSQSGKWHSALRLRKGKRPLLLGIRSSEWLIQLCVGFGVFVDLCSKAVACDLTPSRSDC